MLPRTILAICLCLTAFSPVGLAAQVKVPEWAKRAVWYQIFPERFYNGDPKNDPTLQDILGSWPHDSSGAYQVSDWTGDWYRLQTWEGGAHDFYYHVQRRRYGGDLAGVLKKLDYLENLGITALYFNPLFEAPSLHKYDGTTYHHIDNNFGPDPAMDARLVLQEKPDDPSTWSWTTADSLFLAVVRACHDRGMKVIMDGVFNHVGLNFWAFRDVSARQQASKYRSWFVVKRWDDPNSPENEFDYEGWFGVKELPEFRETADGFVPAVKAYIFHAVSRWMDPDGDGDPSDGIDGWRLDVADMVALPFWREFRRRVRKINPNAYLVGEVWWQDWAHNKMYNAAPWLQGGAFDAVMNYRWAREVIHYFADRKRKISASEFDRRLRRLRDDYPAEVNDVLMNLLDSHDTDRLASQIVNPDDDYDHRDSPRDNPEYDIRKPTPRERRVQKLVAIFQFTYVGAPMIYYGDEAGMWGGDDPDCRKPMLWREFSYADEATHPFGRSRPVDKNHFDPDLFAHYRKLIAIRKAHPALQVGRFETILTDDANDLFVFKRTNNEESVIVALNNSWQTQRVTIPRQHLSHRQRWYNVLDEKQPTVTASGLTLDLEPKRGAILARE